MITIVIPLFNGEKYISRAIQSCIVQNQVSQIIIIDDKSTDKSQAIVNECIEAIADKEIILLSNEDNRGPGFSRNKGIEKATGKYIAFLDADDYYKPQRFEGSVALLEKSKETDGVYTPLVLNIEEAVDTETQEDYQLNKADGEHISFEDMLLRSRGIVSHCGILFKTRFLEQYNIRYADTYWGEDTEMLFMAIQKGKIVYLNDPKTIRSITGDNLTTNLDLNEQYAFHKKWFQHMLQENYSKSVNYYFLKNLIRKHPMFHNRHTPIYRLPKFLWLMAKIITTPKLWSKLL